MSISHSLIAKELLDNSPDAIIALSADGTVLVWSKGATEMFGYQSGEAEGRSLFELAVPVDHLRQEQENLATVLREGSHTHESIRRRRDGSLINVDVSTKVVRDANGAVAYLLSTKKDVTPEGDAGRTSDRSQVSRCAGIDPGCHPDRQRYGKNCAA